MSGVWYGLCMIVDRKSRLVTWGLIITAILIWSWTISGTSKRLHQLVDIYRPTISTWSDNKSAIATVDWELRVSPYWVEDQFLARVWATQYSLDVRLYMLTYKKVETLLKNLAQLWVTSRLIWENLPYGWSDKEFKKLSDRLSAYGIQTYTDEHLWTNFNHTKTYISDKSRFLISTANASYTSFWRNREYWFASNDPTVASNLSQLFEQDIVWDTIDPDQIHPAVLVCPVDCRKKIDLLLDSARTSIHIQAQYIQDNHIIDTLIEYSKNTDIDIKILVGVWQDPWWLDPFGPWVVKIQDEPYNHSKAIMIDSSLLMIWSMNLSTNGLDNNREIGIFTQDRRAVSRFDRQFAIDRDLAPAYDASLLTR